MRQGEHMIGKVNESAIESLLAATQKPFNNRLEAVLYLALEGAGRSQEKTQELAKDLAAVVREFVYVDADRAV